MNDEGELDAGKQKRPDGAEERGVGHRGGRTSATSPSDAR